MTISISNLNINNNAMPGTIVGVLTARDASGTVIPCNFTLTKNSAGFFAISGNNLVTGWGGSAVAGNYPVRVHANGINTRFSGNARFTTVVTTAAPPPLPPPPPPPPPPVPMITVTPANPAIADTAIVGTQVATYAVAMSDGSPFTGTVTLTVNP
jgi:hypothetical protein